METEDANKRLEGQERDIEIRKCSVCGEEYLSISNSAPYKDGVPCIRCFTQACMDLPKSDKWAPCNALRECVIKRYQGGMREDNLVEYIDKHAAEFKQHAQYCEDLKSAVKGIFEKQKK